MKLQIDGNIQGQLSVSRGMHIVGVESSTYLLLAELDNLDLVPEKLHNAVWVGVAYNMTHKVLQWVILRRNARVQSGETLHPHHVEYVYTLLHTSPRKQEEMQTIIDALPTKGWELSAYVERHTVAPLFAVVQRMTPKEQLHFMERLMSGGTDHAEWKLN